MLTATDREWVDYFFKILFLKLYPFPKYIFWLRTVCLIILDVHLSILRDQGHLCFFFFNSTGSSSASHICFTNWAQVMSWNVLSWVKTWYFLWDIDNLQLPMKHVSPCHWCCPKWCQSQIAFGTPAIIFILRFYFKSISHEWVYSCKWVEVWNWFSFF